MTSTKIAPCYEIETRDYTDGVLDVSATYIIHLKNNGRYASIEKQLSTIHPSNTVHILHNEGFKKCEKTLEKQKSTYDLIHAFMTVFRDAQRRGYGAVLILEDDFDFYNGEIIHHASKIDEFVHTHASEMFVYKLGGAPYLLVPSLSGQYTGFSGGTHCCIYSKPYISHMIAKSPQIQDWDAFHNLYTDATVYIHYVPVCYQLFGETENRSNWGESKIIDRIAATLLVWFAILTGIDKSYAAYPYLYAITKLLFWVLLALFIWVVYLAIAPLRKLWRRLSKKYL